MPVFNAERFVLQAIKSILVQTYRNFEFLIIDDGSTDNTAEIIHSLKDERIIFLQKEHTGLPDSLNFGLQRANCEIIARMDADDISSPRRLEIQTDFLNKNPNIRVLSGSYGMIKNNRLLYRVTPPITHSEIIRKMILHNPIVHSTVAFYKSDVLNFGGYNNVPMEDYDLWLRLKDSVKFHNLPEVLGFVRYSDTSISRSNIITAYHDVGKLLKPFQSFESAKNFGITDKKEFDRITGWFEYFYGDRRKATANWVKAGLSSFFDYRIWIASIVCLFNESVFTSFKELRLRYRIEYFSKYFSAENVSIRSEWKELLNSVS